jgi:hypothetical protein
MPCPYSDMMSATTAYRKRILRLLQLFWSRLPRNLYAPALTVSTIRSTPSVNCGSGVIRLSTR